MFEQTITISLYDAATTFDCVAGLPYLLKEERKIDDTIAVYAVPHFTMAKSVYVDCSFYDEDFNNLEHCLPVSPNDFDEPVIERYLN